MAIHGQSEPPRTLEEWIAWADSCVETDWLPRSSEWKGRFQSGGAWVPSAENHPFKGCAFCWRCLADASYFPPSDAPHARDAICFEADGDPDAEDPDEDDCETVEIVTFAGDVVREVKICDPSRPALAGSEEFRRWWHVGASIVGQDFADTGTFFYDPPTRTERS